MKRWHLYKKNPGQSTGISSPTYSKGKMETVLKLYNDLHDNLIVKYSNSR